MQHPLAAIRGARARTTFVLPLGSRGERRLRGHGPLRITPGAGRTSRASLRQPLGAVRGAARSSSIAQAATPAGATRLTTRDRLRWASARQRLRDPRTSGLGPWLG